MSVRRLIVEVEPAELNVTAFCREHGISTWFFYQLRKRYALEGETALEPRSRAPKMVANRTPDWIEDLVVDLRKELDNAGLDAGAATIWVHLRERLGGEDRVPAEATIWRILKAADVIVPQPQKRPRSSWIRFGADRPNELWQSDVTHWRLTDGAEVANIGWLDDHSRYLRHLTAHRRASPTRPDDPDLWRVRYDTIDRDGKISRRHHGRMLHLGIGRAHARAEIICLIHNNDATVISDTGEILAEFTLNPAHGYQRKNG